MIRKILPLIFGLLVTPLSHAAEATFAFYISADAHDLYGEYAFYDHLNEIFDRTKNSAASRYNAVILMDPYSTGDTVKLDVWIEGRRSSLSKTFASKDMGDPATFSEFLGIATGSQLRADQYYLMIDGHGGSWSGVGFDEDDGTRGYGPKFKKEPTFLRVQDISAALAKTLPLPNGRNRWDAILFNSCVMGSLEVMYEYRRVAEYYLAISQPANIVGSDFNPPKRGDVGYIIRYPRYLDFNFKFDMLRRAKRWSVSELLDAAVRSRVEVVRESKDDAQWTATREGEPLFSRLESSGFSFRDTDGYQVEVGKSNYVWVKTDDVVALAKDIKDLSPDLVKFFSQERTDFFTPARLMPGGGDLSSALTDSRMFFEFLLTQQDASREVPRDKVTKVISKLNSIVHGFGTSKVSAPSIYFPSRDIAKSVWDFSSISDPLSNSRRNYDEMVRDQGFMEFNQAAGWSDVFNTYLNRVRSLESDTQNGSERDFLDRVRF